MDIARMHGSRRRRGGFSLIELSAASTIFVIVLGAVLGLVAAGQRSAETGVTRSRLEGQTRAALDRIADELRSARIDPFAGGAATVHGVQYRRRHGAYLENENQSFDDFDLRTASIQWDRLPLDDIALVLAPEEAANGLDDDGDGIVDECEVTRTSAGNASVLCRDVAPNGLSFRYVSARTIEITLTLLGRDSSRNVLRAAASTQVFLRN